MTPEEIGGSSPGESDGQVEETNVSSHQTDPPRTPTKLLLHGYNIDRHPIPIFQTR